MPEWTPPERPDTPVHFYTRIILNSGSFLGYVFLFVYKLFGGLEWFNWFQMILLVFLPFVVIVVTDVFIRPGRLAWIALLFSVGVMLCVAFPFLWFLPLVLLGAQMCQLLSRSSTDSRPPVSSAKHRSLKRIRFRDPEKRKP